MICSERFINDTENGVEYKLYLSLIPSGESVGWNMLVYIRKKLQTENSSENYSDWELVGMDFPQDCERLFGEMKDDIFGLLTQLYHQDLIEYEIEKSAE